MTSSALRSSLDTIAARATASGSGPVAIVRMSGKKAIEIAATLFRPKSCRPFQEIPNHTLTLGVLASDPSGPPIDECLAALWRGPHSYTGEDVVEFHLHGGTRLVEGALEALFSRGARPAQPGEFTRRAFLNGRLDLAQAEAIADLIAAQTAQAARCALGQLAGGLSRRVDALRDRLVAATAEIEAWLDFPEEDLPAENRARIGATLDDGMREIDRLLADARRGRPLREGVRVAIAGRPNSGKSSLLNALLGRERAIVAPHPGTTRDTIEAEIDLDGVPTMLVDMAGLREKPGEIEALGIERARQEVAVADLVVFLLDGSLPLASMDDDAFQHIREREHIVAINKNDLPPAFSRADAERRFPSPTRRDILSISAQTRDGLADLERAILAAVTGRSVAGAATAPLDRQETPLVANARHIQLLESSREALRRASEGLAGRLAFELIAVDLRESLESLGAITGHTDLSEDILDSIFSRFCVGK